VKATDVVHLHTLFGWSESHPTSATKRNLPWEGGWGKRVGGWVGGRVGGPMIVVVCGRVTVEAEAVVVEAEAVVVMAGAWVVMVVVWWS
jgi:hypothetical protein